MFDGSEIATAYLFENLGEALSRNNSIYNRDNVTPTGSFNAIRAAILELNREFSQLYQEEGCSLTMALDSGNYLWVAHLGDSGAVLANGNKIFPLASPNSQLLQHKERVLPKSGKANQGDLAKGSLGMATGFGSLKGLACEPAITFIPKERIDVGSHLLIGTRGIFKYTSKKSLVDYVHARRDRDPLDLAHDFVDAIVDSGDPGKRSTCCLVIRLK